MTTVVGLCVHGIFKIHDEKINENASTVNQSNRFTVTPKES